MKRRHPPGPPNWLAPFALTYRHLIQMWLRPLEFVTELERKYGPVAFFRVFGVRLYVVSDPNLIHEVLVNQKSKFRKLERQMRTMRQVFGNGILTSQGDYWLRQRRMVQKAFSPQMLAGYAEGMLAQTEQLLDRWDAQVEAQDDRANISDEMMRLTLGIATRAFFGDQPQQREEILAEANKALSEAFLREMLSVFRIPDWVPLPGKVQKNRAMRNYVNEVKQLIREKRAATEPSDDLLSAVLRAVDDEGDGTGMTDEQALHELLTIYVAGHHTTSVALSWIFYELAKHPEVEQRVLAEVDRVVGQRRIQFSDLPNLKYTEMVIKEAMRLNPPAYALFAREALEDAYLGEHWIKKGGWIFMYPYVVHRAPQYFENPTKFDPGRFSPEREAAIPQHAYIPFGLGPHVCIGQRFAMIEFLLAVPTILRRYSIQIEPGHEHARNLPLIANHIKGGLPVRLRRRPQSAPIVTPGVSSPTMSREPEAL